MFDLLIRRSTYHVLEFTLTSQWNLGTFQDGAKISTMTITGHRSRQLMLSIFCRWATSVVDTMTVDGAIVPFCCSLVFRRNAFRLRTQLSPITTVPN